MKFQTYSLGVGYRAQSFYMDVAYMLLAQSEDYYIYNFPTDGDYDYLASRAAKPAKIESNTNNIVVTLGWKF